MALSTAVPIDVRSDVTTPIATAELIVEVSIVTSQEVGADQIVSVSAEPIEADIDLEVQSSVLVASTNTADGSRAEFLSATVLKTTGDAMLGIGLMEHQDGTIYISRLLPEGPLGQSPFRVGDKLLSINTKGSDYLDRVTAAALLRALEGTITIVAQNVGGDPKLVETMVEKAKPDSIVGIGLTCSIHGSLEVTKVIASGLFAHSLVSIGDRVISINKIGCNRISARSAVVIIRNSPRSVTFLAETHADTGVVLAASSEHTDAHELVVFK
jgi:C-terminal processing protease CtpA/Prc